MSASAPSDVIAIDILVEPGKDMAAKVRAENQRLRQAYPTGFALDDTHVPHLSVVQCYVKRADLAKIYAAIAPLLAKPELRPTKLLAKGYSGGGRKPPATVVLLVQRAVQLELLQAQLLDALKTYIVPAGTEDAFVRDADGIDASTIEYVRTFPQQRAGRSFDPHITIGQTTPAVARQLENEPFTPYSFDIAGFAVYQLGNNGTARRKLWP